MNLELTDEQAAALLKRAERNHRRRPLFHVGADSNPKGDPRKDPSGTGARAAAAATEAIRPTAGDRSKEAAWGALNGPALSVALRAGEDEDDGERRADRRQTPKDLHRD
jgi:hypothetical protein